MSDVQPDPVATAEAEVAAAEAHLAEAEAVAIPAPVPVEPAPEGLVRLSIPQPWHVFSADGQPTVTFEGIDVSVTVAEQILAAAEAQGVTLRKD